MKFTLSWLKEHLDTEADAAAIAETLTSIGLEVESVEDKSAALKDFIVGYVVSAEKHPNADKLKLCMVDTGTETVQVVCGAPNAHTGMKGVFARPGVVIPVNGEALKIGTIRGVESRGMLCSEREILLSEEHDGIIELPVDAKTGSPAAEALGLNDPVIDVSITPNRGDATSVHGIARDLAAAGIGRLKSGSVSPVAGAFPSPKKVHLNFTPDTASTCSLFAGRYIRNVKNGPSPKWVQERLRAIGLRPISALVDVTNLISYDRGRPLHVFDADKLSGDMQARLAKDGEQLTALDGKTYTLDSSMCVIADEKSARGIGGIMGGEDTGCTEITTNVFVESAFFDPASIAATGRKLGIISDARYRFERGVDPEFVIPGLDLATKLILEFCGGEPSEIVVGGAVPQWRRKLSFSTDAVMRLAGLDVPKPEIFRILTNLGFVVEQCEPLQVTPPSWRSDIDGSADLVEEVVRIHGLDKVPSAPMSRPNVIARPVLTPAQRRLRTVRRTLAARGFNETISFSFIARNHAALFGGGDDARQIENPIAADLDALRPSLLPSLLAAAARNQARGISDLMFFEIGAQFESGMPGAQKTVAAGIRMGAGARSWTKTSHASDAFDAKADMLAAIEAAMGGTMTAPVKAGAAAWYHPGRSGTLALGPKTLAYFGELHPKIAAAFDLKGPLAAFEIFLDAIPESKAKSKARPLFAPSPFQSVERDFAFVVDSKTSADEVLKAAKGAERALIDSVSVFDIYEGKGVPEGKKSLAISVRLQPKDKTLTDAEIEAIGQKIVAAVTKTTGGTLRT
ncbi:MAG TPA: phenylalanine--tRNA ligase subunit beta [Rhizomicrobium sp.]|nr:phenylalanine--tRNA ligase subunit beta [Rhizomicrobium sp.]